MEVSGQHHVPGTLPPENNIGINLVRGWAGITAGLQVLKKGNPLP